MNKEAWKLARLIGMRVDDILYKNSYCCNHSQGSWKKKLLIMAVSHQFVFTLCKQATIHQVTTMLATSKNVLFPGHSHLITTGIYDPTFSLSTGTLVINKMLGYQYWWSAGGYDLEKGRFYK